MFQGAVALNLDAKGRLAIPARHRDALAVDKGQVVLTAHPHGCCLVYPVPDWNPIRDHVLRAHDNIEEYESLLMSMLQAANSRQSLQQNTDMRKIAAYAAMLAVPTAIAGIYGMNFEEMPELDWVLGYPLVLVVMGLSMLVMFRAFKRSGWL